MITSKRLRELIEVASEIWVDWQAATTRRRLYGYDSLSLSQTLKRGNVNISVTQSMRQGVEELVISLDDQLIKLEVRLPTVDI